MASAGACPEGAPSKVWTVKLGVTGTVTTAPRVPISIDLRPWATNPAHGIHFQSPHFGQHTMLEEEPLNSLHTQLPLGKLSKTVPLESLRLTPGLAAAWANGTPADL